MADQLLLDRQFDDNGNPGAGYIASFFLSGTTTPVTVFTDTGVSIPAGVSVTASAAGRFAQTFHPGGAALKCVITTPLGATVETIDPLPATPLSSSAAENVSFSPTVALPFSNVQDAIEGSVAAAATGFNAFGLGITGNSGLLADIDATNIGAGQYRFDATTAGTFPTGSAAANTGTLVVERETSASFGQFLYDEVVNRRWFRRASASTLGPWRQDLIVTQGAAAAAITTIETALTNSSAALPVSSAVWATLIGVDQTWQNVIGSRAASTSYRNLTGKPIMVAINTNGGTNPPIQVSTDNSTWISLATASNDDTGFSFIVPNLHYYRVNGATTLTFWAELRA